MMNTQTPEDRAAQWQLWSDSHENHGWIIRRPPPIKGWLTVEEASHTAWTHELLGRVVTLLAEHPESMKNVPFGWFSAMAAAAFTNGNKKAMRGLDSLLHEHHGKLVPSERAVWGESFDIILETPSTGIDHYREHVGLLSQRFLLWLHHDFPKPPIERFSFTSADYGRLCKALHSDAYLLNRQEATVSRFWALIEQLGRIPLAYDTAQALVSKEMLPPTWSAHKEAHTLVIRGDAWNGQGSCPNATEFPKEHHVWCVRTRSRCEVEALHPGELAALMLSDNAYDFWTMADLGMAPLKTVDLSLFSAPEL